ncbi:MAG: hypothetical protein V4519_02625 [Patescibacteria group bacterium]
MSTNYERIKVCVASSTISDTDKKYITDLFAEVADQNLAEIAELFESKPKWVAMFNDNRKKKQEAYASGDASAWQSILEEEKKMMDDLLYDRD